MGFSDFHGNADVVRRLREMLARDHFPQAVILAGPCGIRQIYLSLMLAKAMNCLDANHVRTAFRISAAYARNCVRIAQAEDLSARCAEAVETRENMRETDKKETRLFVQTHPDVLVIPPDPPQMMIKVDQVRKVIESVYYRPAEGKEKVYIFTDSAFMKEAANSLLKILEEPPDFATIFLLTDNPGELLPTLKSRSMIVTLAPLTTDEIEQYLAKHRPEWKAPQRALVARLCGRRSRPGPQLRSGRLHSRPRQRAHNFEFCFARRPSMAIYSKLPKAIAPGRMAAKRSKNCCGLIYSLLQDLMFLGAGTPALVRNTDIQAELTRMAANADFDWIALAAHRLGEVERGMRRNLLRSLSLDAFAAALEKA